MVKKIAIRLGVNSADKVEVIRDFGTLSATGVASFDRVGAAASKANTKLDGQSDRLKRLAAEAQAMKFPVAEKFAEFGGVNFDPPKSRADSIAAFGPLIADLEKAEREALALRSALDPLGVAQERYAEKLERLNTLRSRDLISEAQYVQQVHRETDALNAKRVAHDAEIAAIEREGDAMRARMAVPVDTRLQQGIDRTVGIEREAILRPSGYEDDYLRLLDQQEREVRALKAALDPLSAAQDRFNDTVARLDRLKPHLGLELYDKGIKQATRDLEMFERSQLSNRGTQFTSFQLTNLSFQLNDVVTGVLSGQNLLQIAAQQSGQVFQILQMSEGGVAGGLKSIMGLLTPVRVGLMGLTGVVAISAATAYKYSVSQDALALSLTGVGRASGLTTASLDAMSGRVAAAAEIGIGAARDQQMAYLRLGVTAPEILEKIGKSTRNYALIAGGEAKDAVNEFGGAFANPTRGIEVLAKTLGDLDGATIKNIKNLQAQGDLIGAQKALWDAYSDRIDSAREHVNSLTRALENLWNAPGNYLDAVAQRSADIFSKKAEDIIRRGDRLKAKNGGVLPDSIFFDKDAYEQAKKIVALQEDSAKKTAERNALDKQSQAVIESALPKEVQRNKLINERILLEKRQAAGIGDRGENERAIAALNKQMADLDKGKTDRRAASLARTAESVEVNIRKTLELADAYLESDEAALKAETSRKALTEATKKGTDAEAAMRRELNLTIAQQAAEGAKSVATARAQAEVQEALNARIEAGGLSTRDLSEAMARENALRPLLVAQALAEGEAKEKLTKIIQALNVELDRVEKSQDKTKVLTATEGAREEIELLNKKVALLKATDAQGVVSMARYKALIELLRNGYTRADSSPESQAYMDSQIELAKAQLNYDRAKAYHDEIRALGEREFDRFGDLLTKGDLSWKSWADAGKAAILDVSAELTKLALLNPAKNWLFGQNNPTIKDSGGFLSSILNMYGKAKTPTIAPSAGVDIDIGGILASLPKFAKGTLNSPEGWALLGEDGPEVAKLPRGTRVYNAAHSRQLISDAANTNGQSGWNGPLIGSVIIQAQDVGSFQRSRAQVAAQLGQAVQSAAARIR